ncbi:translation initiation factor IF3-1, mitochondrial isoform X2 [Magnolia sinica]|uniref:translation initiation factor IF3-1, mitochondrial isoform X2 n=1 Tax=Magnolia sinica TaxID=86752 RepID=UPI0026599DC7|nr:translation initiation factor IF3-1, mitochondrial isoform X2 [Magnolia sinica]
MAFWGRVRPLRFKFWSYQCKRWHSHIYGVASIDYISEGRRAAEKIHPFVPRRPTEQYFATRFFAAPVQVKPKKEEKDHRGPRMNMAITSEYVRLVTDEGHSIVSRREALDRAMKLKLDLVEVGRDAKPPVCKIMDYHKEKYKRQATIKDRLKKKPEVLKGDCKEVRFTGKIEQKDLQMKAEMVKRQMERGYRVKCMAMGTENEDLAGLLSRFSALIEDVAFVESGPFVEKRQAYVLVRHSKFGPTKKGKKPAKTVEAVSSEVHTVAASRPTNIITSSVQMPPHIKEEADPSEHGLDTEHDVFSDQEVDALHSSEVHLTAPADMPESNLGEKTTWSDFDGTDDFEKVFGFSDETMDSVDGPSEDTNITELLHQKLPDTSIANGSGKNQRQIFESGTSAELRFGPPALKPVPDDPVKAKPAFGKVEIGKAFTPPNLSTPGETWHSGRSELKTRFQPMKPTERSSQGTETKFPAWPADFPPEVERTHVNNRGPGRNESVRPDRASLNQRWQPQQVPTASLSTEQKLSKDPCIDENRKNGPSDPKEGRSASSYGIFSAPKTAASGDRRIPAEENITKGPGLGGSGRNQDPPKLRSENQRQDADKAQRGGWGIFSGETTSPDQHRSTDSRMEVQR